MIRPRSHARALSSATVSSCATSLLFHAALLAAATGIAVGSSAEPLRVYGGPTLPALRLTIADAQFEPAPHDANRDEPPIDVVITPDRAWIGARRFHRQSTADALSAPPPFPVAPDEPSPPTDARRAPAASGETQADRPPSRPRPAAARRRSSPARPASETVPLPTGPVEFLGPPHRYPEQALADRWEGTVVLLIHIDGAGRVADVRIERSSGFAPADAEAVQTVRQWRAVARKPGTSPGPQVVRKAIVFRLSR
jgi:protein TonB